MGRLADASRGIWTDLRQGKDVELYITVPLAATVIVANLLNRASATLVSTMTLALLGLLVVALLKLRRLSDRLQDSVDRFGRPDDLAARLFRPEHDVEEVKDLIKASRKDVWLWGATLAMHVSILTPYLERAIADGLNVKVMLIKPGPSSVMTMAAFRAGHPDETELQHELASNLFRLRQAASRLSTLATQQPCGTLEVRVIDYLAPYALYAYDPHQTSGRIDLRIAGLNIQHDSRPTFTLDTRDERWYRHFRDQFEAGWTMATEEIAAP